MNEPTRGRWFAACGLAALVAAFSATAASAVVTVYSSGNIAAAILDNTITDIPLAVSDDLTITDVNVRIRLNHTFDSDLLIQVIHPGTTTINLSNHRGGGGDNFGGGTNDCSGTKTVFDDEAATAIGAGVAPFAGSFIPDGSLATLDSLQSGGSWTVRIADTFDLDQGTVGCVELELTLLDPTATPTITPTPSVTPTPTSTPTPSLTPTPSPAAPEIPTLSLPGVAILVLTLLGVSIVLLRRR